MPALGFGGGFDQGTESQVGIQSQQLRNALMIADQINQQRQQEHSNQMSEWQKELATRTQDIADQRLQMDKDYKEQAGEDRKLEIERKKQADMDNRLNDAQKAWPGLLKVSGSYGKALAFIPKDIQEQFIQNLLRDEQGRANVEYDAQKQRAQEQPAQQPQGVPMPTGPQVPQGSPAPMPALSDTMGLPMMGGMPGMGAPGGSPMPPQQGSPFMPQTGMPMAPQGPDASMMAPGVNAPLPAPMAAPVAPPVPQGVPLPTGPRQVTRDEVLGMMPEAYKMEVEKAKAKQEAEAIRAKAMALKAELERPKANAAMIRAENDRNRTQLEREAFEQRVGKFANSAANLMQQRVLDEKKFNDIATYHKIMGSVAQQNANTGRMNANSLSKYRVESNRLGNQAFGIWQKVDTDARQYEGRAIELGKLADKAEEDSQFFEDKLHNALRDMNAIPSDNSDAKMAASRAVDQAVTSWGPYKKRAEALRFKADEALENSKDYRGIAGTMKDELAKKGFPAFGDNKGSGPTDKLPSGGNPKRPNTSSVNSVLKSLGIP